MEIKVKDNRDSYNKLLEARKEYESEKPKLEDWLEALNKYYTYNFIIRLNIKISEINKYDVLKIVGECCSGKTTLENIIRKMRPDIKAISTNGLMKNNEYLNHEHILISRKDWKKDFFS